MIKKYYLIIQTAWTWALFLSLPWAYPLLCLVSSKKNLSVVVAFLRHSGFVGNGSQLA